MPFIGVLATLLHSLLKLLDLAVDFVQPDSMFNFEIIHCDWQKRRAPDGKKSITLLSVENLELTANHFCEVYVDVEGEGVHKLKGRVIQNQITGVWTINAVGSGGAFINLKIAQSN